MRIVAFHIHETFIGQKYLITSVNETDETIVVRLKKILAAKYLEQLIDI